MKISVIHETRAGGDTISTRKPRTAEKALDAYRSRMSSMSGEHEIEYIFGVDEDDPISIDMAQKLSGVKVSISSPKTKWGPRLCDVHAQNEAAEISTGSILMQGADDVRFPDKWDRIVADALGAHVSGNWNTPAVLGVGDPHFEGGEYSGDGMLGTLIMTRGTFDTWGFFYYPEYDGMSADLDVTAKAALDGILVDAYDRIYFRHFWHGGMNDAERDAIHDRHMHSACFQIGYAVISDRMNMGYPNVMVGNLGETRADEDLKAGRFGTIEPERMHQDRIRRGFAHVGNKEHAEGSVQWHYIRGHWKEADEMIEPLIRKYHMRWCGGRFRFTVGFLISNTCRKMQGLERWRREDEHDRSKMEWLR